MQGSLIIFFNGGGLHRPAVASTAGSPKKAPKTNETARRRMEFSFSVAGDRPNDCAGFVLFVGRSPCQIHPPCRPLLHLASGRASLTAAQEKQALGQAGLGLATTMHWFWIGSHAGYDRLLRRR
jgi:hypothetical protein